MDRRLHPDEWDEEDITIRHGRGRRDDWLGPEQHVDRIAVRHRSRSRDVRNPNIIVAPRGDPEVVDALEDIRDELHGIRRQRSPRPEWRDPSPNPAAAAALILDRDRLSRDRLERDRLEREVERLRREDRGKDHDMERQLEVTRNEIRRLESRLRDDEREGRLRGDLELDRMREDERRRSERELWRAESNRREADEREKEERLLLRLEDKKRKEADEHKRLLAEHQLKEEKKKHEEEEMEKLTIAQYRLKQDEKKRKEEELREKFKLEEMAKKEKEKKEKEEWKRRFEEEKHEEEEKKKKKEQEIEDEMRKRLHRFGFQDNQVDVLVDPKAKEKHLHKIHRGDLPSNALVVSKSGPTLIRIHKNHLDVETLKYFKIHWEYDTDDPSYFVIYDELDQKDTDILFEHTRKIRKKFERETITVEAIGGRGRHKEPQLAWVKRRPSASPSRRVEEKVERRRSRSVIRLVSSS